jgi:O-antigen/teichoic acid export membrane protein
MSSTHIPVRMQRLRQFLGPLFGPGLLLFAIWRVGDLANLASKVLLGRYLPDLDFGAVEPVVSVVTVIAIPVGIVFQIATKSISRLLERNRTAECAGLIRDLFLVSCAGSLLSAAAVALARNYILARLHLQGGCYAWLLAAFAALAWWQPLATSLIQGSRRFALSALPSVVTPFLVLLLTLGMVRGMSGGLTGALGARILGTAAGTATVLVLLGGMARRARESYREEHPAMLRMAGPMLVWSLSAALLMHFDRLFARNFLLSDSGGYGAIVTLGQIPLWLVTPVTFVAFPLVAAEHAGQRDTARYYAQALGLGLAIAAACVVALSLAARPVLRAWNPDYLPYAGSVWLYAAAMGCHGLTDLLAGAEMARSRYGFLWIVVPAAAGLAILLYALRGAITLPALVAVVAAARAVLLAALVVFLLAKYLRRRLGRPARSHGPRSVPVMGQ